MKLLGACIVWLGGDSVQHNMTQTSVAANNNDVDVDNIANNNRDCVISTTNSKYFPSVVSHLNAFRFLMLQNAHKGRNACCSIALGVQLCIKKAWVGG